MKVELYSRSRYGGSTEQRGQKEKNPMRMPYAVAAVGLALSACGGPSAPASKPAAPAPATAAAHDRWPEFAAGFIESSFRADPYFAVQAGRHEFDGQMPDWSAAALAADAERLKKQRAEAAGFDAATLTADERIEGE